MTTFANYRALHLPTIASPQEVGWVRIVQRDRAHTMIQFRTTESPDVLALKTGTPFSVSWGPAADETNTEYGYVAYTGLYEPNAKNRGHLTQVTGWGVTFWMKQPRQRAWEDRSLRSILEEVCSGHRLAAVIPESPRLDVPLPRCTQDGVSDWEFLHRLCAQYGIHIHTAGPWVCFIDKARAFEQFFALGGRPHTLFLHQAITAQFGEATAQNTHRRQIIQGVDPRTHSVYESSGEGTISLVLGVEEETPLFDNFVHLPSDTEEQAREQVRGAQAETRWTHVASGVQCDGNHRVRPGSIVFVPEDNDAARGYWYVIEAEHVFNRQEPYLMHLKLGRDSRGWDASVPLPTRRVPTLPPVRLYNRKWVAEHRQVVL